jgi:hypothetical protein
MPVEQFELLELKAEISSVVVNRYDYDSIVFGGIFVSPEGDTTINEGFYYQHFIKKGQHLVESESPHFRLRFTPDKPGKWNFKLFLTDKDGSYETPFQSFSIGASFLSGYLRFQPNSNYLHNSRGEVVFLAGENIAWANTPSGGDSMTYYLNRLHEHEMNFAKLMMTPWAYQIEWSETGWRNYAGRQAQAFMMDSIFRMSDRLNIYLQLAFSIHNELNIGYPAEDWTSNPYNLANGGCCSDAWEFFTHPAALSAFRNRLRYLVARWGYSTKLFAWELMSEADNFPWYRQHQQAIADWSDQMAAFLRSKDHVKRAVSVGFALSSNNHQVWQSNHIQFTQLHHYKFTPDIEGEIASLHAMYLKSFGKPVLTGEFGLGHVGDSLVIWDPDGLALHNSLWTAAMTGSFAGVVPWFWENYIDIQNLYSRFTPLVRFMNKEGTNPDELLPEHLPTSSSASFSININPRFDLLQKSKSKQFTLMPTGILLPTQDSLPVFLYGPQSLLAGLRNPPAFNGNWQQAGLMRIKTGVQALNAILQVKVDGQVMLEQTAQSNSEYVVLLPQGTHQIVLDNRGQGLFSILEISMIVFENYAPALRAFGLKGQDRALVWVHNRFSHWQNAGIGSVPAVSGQITLTGFQGSFLVSFCNTGTGAVDSVMQIVSGHNGLVVDIPSLAADLALRIQPVPTSIEPSIVDQAMAYPNPFHSFVRIILPPNNQSEASSLQITDLTGRLMHLQKHNNAMHEGFVWDGTTLDGIDAQPGIYFFRLIFKSGKALSGKLIKL